MRRRHLIQSACFSIFMGGMLTACSLVFSPALHRHPTHQAAPYSTKQSVKLGDDHVVILNEKHGPGKTFVHVHQSEYTALAAARAVIQQQGGQVITLVHSGGRNIVFHLRGRRYEFDPNRIFTSVGIKKTLAQYSEYTPAAYRCVKRLANQIQRYLPKSEKIIAVHNNETYSMRDYFAGHSLDKEARSIYVNQQQYYRNFYLVTQKKDYLRLKQLQFNSIWQALQVSDDGSLSVLWSRGHYINVEAGYDQLKTQIEMLKKA